MSGPKCEVLMPIQPQTPSFPGAYLAYSSKFRSHFTWRRSYRTRLFISAHNLWPTYFPISGILVGHFHI